MATAKCTGKNLSCLQIGLYLSGIKVQQGKGHCSRPVSLAISAVGDLRGTGSGHSHTHACMYAGTRYSPQKRFETANYGVCYIIQ